MKRSINLLSLLALALLISTVSAKAQTAKSIDTNVPFNFNVGKSELKFEKRGHDRYLTGITLPDRAIVIAAGKPGKTNFTRAKDLDSGRSVKQS
jgi:PIN domain nuclease of toxin-antitoxin system